MAATSFFALAPCSYVLFKGIHFNIGESWQITEDNFIGILLASAASLLWIISYFGLYNLNKDKEDFEVEELDNNDCGETNDNPAAAAETRLWTTQDILKDRYIVLLLSAETFAISHYCQMELEINITAVELFHWPMTQLAILTSIVVGLSAGTLLLMQKKLMTSALNIFFLYVVSLVILVILQSLILLTRTTMIQEGRKVLQIVLIFTAVLCNVIQGFDSTIYCQWLMVQ